MRTKPKRKNPAAVILGRLGGYKAAAMRDAGLIKMPEGGRPRILSDLCSTRRKDAHLRCDSKTCKCRCHGKAPDETVREMLEQV